MNTELTTIQNKVNDNIAAKAAAAPNPALVKAEDTAEIFSNILTYLDTTLAPPPTNPAGVSFTTAPTFTIGTNSITESASVVNDNGDTINVAGATLSVPYAVAGKKRLDAIVVNYLATPAVYERIEGDEVASTAIAARKPIPANRLFAHDIDVTDGVVSTTNPTNAHAQNTDTHTTSRIFELGKLLGTVLDGGGTPVAEPTGSVVLLFGKANDNSRKTAIREYWETVAGEREYYLQKCLSYTGTGSDVWTDIGGGGPDPTKADKNLTINTQSTSYTLALSDAGGMVRMNVASANTLTVPPNSSVAFPIGTQIVCKQVGAGQTTIVAGSGVTINVFGNTTKSAGQHASWSLIKVGTNEWALDGNLTT